MARISYGAPTFTPPGSIAGGVADLGDIVAASYQQMRLVDNSNASAVALEEAYNRRTAAVRAATGIDLGNPLIAELTPEIYAEFRRQRPEAGFDELGWMQTAIAQQRQRYDERLWQLAGQYPAASAEIRASTPIAREAEQLANAADADLSRLMQSRPGWDSFAASFVGAGGASLSDPLTIGSLFLGGGPGAARTVAGRILSVATKEALLNGATEAAAQPFVQDWRRQAGLDNGFDEAARNVLIATALGGVLGAGGRGGYEALTALARRRGRLSPLADRALAGDLEAQRQILSELPRDSLPAEARGALDALEIAEVSQRGSPLAGADAVSAASIRRAEILETRAALHAQNPALAAITTEPLGIDEDQVGRILADFERDIVQADLPPVAATIELDRSYVIKHVSVDREDGTMYGWGNAQIRVGGEKVGEIGGREVWESLGSLRVIDPPPRGDEPGAGAIVAVLKVQGRGSNTRINHIVVTPDLQRQGIGRALIQMAQRQYPGLQLDTSADGEFSAAGAALFNAVRREATSASPQKTPSAPSPSRPTAQFIKSIGGVDPGSPLAQELRARGIDNRAMPGLYRKGGLTDLDNVPFAELPPALQARMRPEGDTVYARQQDLLDAMEEELRPDATAPRQLGDEAEARLVDLDAKVRRVLAGRPGSDEAFVREAIAMAETEGLDIDAAIGRLEAQKAGTRLTLPESQFADVPAEPEDLASLEASLMQRAGEEGDDGIDFAALEAAGFGDDALVAWGDGTISIADLRSEIEETQWLESIVSACKVGS